MLEWPVVDSVRFARQRGMVRCSVRVSEFKRVAQTVLGNDGDFEVRLDGFEDSESRPCLRLRVKGCVAVACQRCLEPLVLEIASDSRFVLAEREQDLIDPDNEGDDVESLLADRPLDALMLAEDEILLQIPMAPMHDERVCTPPQWAADSGRDNSPFAALGVLTHSKD